MSTLDKITKARATLILSQPFFGALALHLRVEQMPDGATMATDGTRLLYSADFVDSLSPQELAGVLAHEVMHNALLHHTRRESRDADLWNVAADHAINLNLLSAGFTLPEGRLADPRFAGEGAESIYAILLGERRAKAAKDAQDGRGSPGQGDAMPGPTGSAADPATGEGGDPGRCGRVQDAADPKAAPSDVAHAESQWRARVRQALSVARAQGAGSLPGFLAEVDKVTGESRIDWRDTLRRFIDRSSVKDYSWTRPNRRFIGEGLILPGAVSDSLSRLVFVVDTSGSIDLDILGAMSAEIQAALDDGAADNLTILGVDTRVQSVDEFERGDVLDFTPQGRGGTSFRPAFDWIAEHAADAACVVYLTDLDARDFGDAPPCPVIWAAYGSVASIAYHSPRVPFGEVIHVKI